jgi:hypothetical protein
LDDGLPLTSFGQIKESYGIVKGHSGPDVWTQPSIAYPLHNPVKLGAICLYHKVD